MPRIKNPFFAGLAAECTDLRSRLHIRTYIDKVTKENLQSAFVPFGELKEVHIPLDKTTGKHKGFGFVQFIEDEDAEAAIDNMNENELFGRTLRVNLAREYVALVFKIQKTVAPFRL